jgi:anion-transporting  ArsA/GET3 family ATPase
VDSSEDSDWPGVRLHVVTGKGGTGKTTVAAALALALASRGKQVLLCEVEGRQGIAQLFDVPPLPYEERRIATGPAGAGETEGGEVYALAIEPEAALLEYLAMYYRLGRAGKALDRFGVIDFATTIAPGVRDVLLTGKVYEAVHRNRRGKNQRQYDAVVLDAPPTGRIAQFLNVNSELAGLAKVGPIRSQADTVMTLLRSERTRVHLVTVLEDMPVQETADGIAELRKDDLPVGGVVVNLVRNQELDAEERTAVLGDGADRKALEVDLREAGVPVDARVVDGLLREGRDHAQRRQLEDEQRARIQKLDVPTYELPRLSEGIDLGGLYELAADLIDQGMA